MNRSVHGVDEGVGYGQLRWHRALAVRRISISINVCFKRKTKVELEPGDQGVTRLPFS
jgi:hypothetical protein